MKESSSRRNISIGVIVGVAVAVVTAVAMYCF